MFMVTCKDPMLRLIRALPEPEHRPVQVLGVDEFALRRRWKYAAVLVDMTTHRPVDVLANRTADTFPSWLRRHPEVQMICRDRAGSFRDGACAGAPQAKQVADMWHVLHNLAEAVERIVGRHRAELRGPASGISRSTSGFSAATACARSLANSASAAAPWFVSLRPMMSTNFSSRPPTAPA
ncbi:transposase [Streptomyces sp. NPDC021622]|uniref:transposase n=1 Tax=Streptomyces sp. NPDC021622 TaxID=3155013 RepID=UPI0033EA51F5